MSSALYTPHRLDNRGSQNTEVAVEISETSTNKPVVTGSYS